MSAAAKMIAKGATTLDENIRSALVLELSRIGGARLYGSWNTLEAHLPRSGAAAISSLSDVDVMLGWRPEVNDVVRITDAVRRVARSNGVELSKVSVRHQAELEQLWGPACLKLYRKTKCGAGAFLSFWTALGAVEAAVTVAHTNTSEARAYGLSKFFFKYWRALALLADPDRPASYGKVADIVSTISLAPCTVIAALKVKVGSQAGIAAEDARQLLLEQLWNAQARSLVDVEAIEFTGVVRRNMLAWFEHGAELPVDGYVEASKRFVLSPAMESARLKAARDLKGAMSCNER